MSEQSSVQAELKKLASMLAVPVTDLIFLDQLDMAQLRYLGTAVNQAMQAEQAPLWASLARAARFLPRRLAANLAQTMLGAHVTANITYHLSPQEAIGIARHFSIPFLADVATHLIPERSQPLLNAVPLPTMQRLTKHMTKQQDFATMGAFLDYLERDRVLAIVQHMQKPEAILRTAAYCQHKAFLAEIVTDFSDEQLLDLLHAAHEHALWEEVLVIGSYLSPQQMARLGQLSRQLSLEEAAHAAETLKQLSLETALNPIWEAITSP